MKLLTDIRSDPDKSLISSPGDRTASKLLVFANFAVGLASLSTCKRTKVGSIVVPQDLSEVLAIGYNGPPAGLPNNQCRDRVGDCGCVHSEANAMVKLRTRARDLVFIATVSPCEACAGLIINSKAIAAVVYLEEYRNRAGLDLLEETGILAVKIAGE
jgi:deoxycytidylate deaminase